MQTSSGSFNGCGDLHLPENTRPEGAARVLIALIRAYKLFVSPYFFGSCRFVPSCADYAREALECHGAVRGSWLAAKRLARCHPMGGAGLDPVPPSTLGRIAEK